MISPQLLLNSSSFSHLTERAIHCSLHETLHCIARACDARIARLVLVAAPRYPSKMTNVGPTGLPSPAVSTGSPAASTITQGGHSSGLPVGRLHPLQPGSRKEIALINYVDDKILRITRRYAKKFSSAKNDRDDALGYTSFDEVIADLDPVIDIVWISGTRKSSFSGCESV